ncbi:MAG: hypothetical protein HYS12_04145 [Planctomycetes bacterium]|nr:hypothetical protein [Planctomycetota bacterium]
MATKTSFKQQCPSCEAMVPIRDPNLIGRKIDCPKCKYRFVVEEPADATQEEAPAKPAKKATGVKAGAKGAAAAGATSKRGDTRDKPEKGDKEEKKISSTMMIGVGLAVISLALVGLGICLLAGVFDSKPDKKPETKTTKTDAPKQPQWDKPAPTVDNLTNLLPNDSQAVLYFNNSGKDGVPPVLPNSNLADALFTNGAFDPAAFRSKFGFLPGDIDLLILAINIERGWSFGVIRTKTAVTKDTLAGLNLEPMKAKIQDFEYFRIKVDLDPLGVALFKNLKIKPTTLHLYDSNTLVLADENPMERFLQAKRKPSNLTQPPGPSSGGNQDGAQGGPGGAGGGPPGGGMMGGPPGGGIMGGGGPPGGGIMGGGGPPGAGMRGEASPSPSSEKQATASEKQLPGGAGGMMGGGPPGGGIMGGGAPGGGMMGGPPGGGMMGMMGGQGSSAAATPSDSFLTIQSAMKRVFDNMDFSKRALTIVFDKKTTDALIIRYAILPLLAALEVDVSPQLLMQVLPTPGASALALRDFTKDRFSVAVAAEFDRKETASGIIAKNIKSFAPRILKDVEDEFGIKISLVGGGGGAMGGPPMGGGGMGGGGPPGGGFGGGGAPGGGIMGGGGAPGGIMGGGGPPGGGIMGGGGPPGGGMMGGGGGQNEGKGSKLEVKVRDKIVITELELHLVDLPQIVDRIKDFLGEGAIVLKNEALMVYHRSHVHLLADGLKHYVESRNQFPRGTASRALKGGTLPPQPDERIAWTAELLPYIDKSFASLKVDPDKSWKEGDNVHAAALAIPYYLAADEPKGAYPLGSWRRLVPGLRSPVATIHFVAIAGIGLDAADYQIGNPATAKKLGIFGYDRVTKLGDIVDGLDRTIALIQVPPTFRTCWLAGGGSTVRGVPEEDSVAPFVCIALSEKLGRYSKGTKGTFAIMADGKVRFIPADMKPETFKALCTIAGGEKIDDLNHIAPVVPDNTVTLKPTLPADLPKPPASPPEVGGKLPEGWERIDDTAGRYSVALRTNGKEVQLQQTLPTPAGNLTVYLRGKEFGKDEGALVVAYNDYPSVIPTGGVKAALDGAVKLGAANLGKVLSEREITIQGHPGREVQVDTKNGPMKVRIILAGKRMYQLWAGGKPSLVSDKDAQTFMDSFKITN